MKDPAVSEKPVGSDLLTIGQHITIQAADLQEFLTAEWLGTQSYPVIHVSAGGGGPGHNRSNGAASQTGAKGAPAIVRDVYPERRVYTICAEGNTAGMSIHPHAGDAGTEVVYGQSYRLMNVYLNRCLVSGDGVTARLEDDKATEALGDQCGRAVDTWRFAPRHKTRGDNEVVRRGDQAFIIHVATGRQLSVVDIASVEGAAMWSGVNDEALVQQGLEPPQRMVAALSSEGVNDVPWAIMGYFEGDPGVPRSALRTLDAVVIFHKEAEGFLTVEPKHNGADTDRGVHSVALEQSYVEKSNYSVLELNYRSSAIFTVESETAAHGEGLHFSKRRYRLRHAATHAYLTYTKTKLENGKIQVAVKTTSNRSDPNTLIRFQPLDSDNTEKYLTLNSFARIEFATDELYIHARKPPRGEVTGETGAVGFTAAAAGVADPTARRHSSMDTPTSRVGAGGATAGGTGDGKKSWTPCIYDVDAVATGYFEDAFAIRSLPNAERAGMLSVKQPQCVLSEFVKRFADGGDVGGSGDAGAGSVGFTRMPSARFGAGSGPTPPQSPTGSQVSSPQLSPPASPTALSRSTAAARLPSNRTPKRLRWRARQRASLCEEVCEFLRLLIRWVSGAPIGVDPLTDKLPHPIAKHQRILFEHGLHTLLFTVLQAPLAEEGAQLDALTRGDPALQDIYQLGFSLVEQMVKGAKDLAVQLTTYIPFLEEHLKHELIIASALMQIISDNRDILESLTQRQLESFCFLIPQYGHNPTYLNLLGACCVCEGEAVTSNQLVIVTCLAGSGSAARMESLIAKNSLPPCSVKCLRVFYKIAVGVHGVDGLCIKPYATFPPSTERKVARFLQRYEADRQAKRMSLLTYNCDMSSSESSLSTDDEEVEPDTAQAQHENEDASDDEDAESEMDRALLTHHEGFQARNKSVRQFLFKKKVVNTGSAGPGFSRLTSDVAPRNVLAGCWVWKSEAPSVTPEKQWARVWAVLSGGYLTFSKRQHGAPNRTIPVVEISLVQKGVASRYCPPAPVKGLGITAEMNRLCLLSKKENKVLICTESIGERNALLHALQREVNVAETALESTKALSGDPIFAKLGHNSQGELKKASLQGRMKRLLRKQGAHRVKAFEAAPPRVAIGTRYDTTWQLLTDFVRHASLPQFQYLEAQLALCSKLCLGGTPKALAWLQTLLPRDVITKALKLESGGPNAAAVKAAFADLAIKLYLVPMETAAVDAFRHRAFVADLKAVVTEHLRRTTKSQVHMEVDHDDILGSEQLFTSAIFSLCGHLVSSGAYQKDELMKLVPLVVRTVGKHPPKPNTEPIQGGLKGRTGQLNAPKVIAYRRDANRGSISDAQIKIMETKLQGCRVLHSMFDNRSLVVLFSKNTEMLSLLTNTLLATVLHTEHDVLFLTSIQLLFRSLSLDIEDGARASDFAHARLAVILRDQLEAGKADVMLSLLRLLDGALANVDYNEMVTTTLSVMKTVTRMIYLNQNDSDQMKRTQCLLDALGLAPLIAVMVESKNEDVVFHSLVLMSALMHGGNVRVQTTLANFFLSERHDEAMFLTIKNRISNACSKMKELKSAHQSVAANQKAGSADDSGTTLVEARTVLEKDIHTTNLYHVKEVLRVLQLFNEGHYTIMQNYLRQQPDNVVSYNIVNECLLFTNMICSVQQQDDFLQPILVQAFNTLTEFCQGPCKGNQVQLIKGNIALHVMSVLSARYERLSRDEVNDVRVVALLCLHAVLEGVSMHDNLAMIVTHTLDARALRQVIEEVWADRRNESSLEVAFNIFILAKLMKMMPSLHGVPGYAFFDAMTGGIEICRDGKLERLYFRIPPVSANLSQATKEDLLRSVNRATSTSRIFDFYYRAEGLIFEIEYYQKIFYAPRDTSWGELLRKVQYRIHLHSAVWHNLLLAGGFAGNIILVATAAHAEPAVDPLSPAAAGVGPAFPTWAVRFLVGISMFQAVVTTLILTDFLVSRAPLLAFKRNKRQKVEAERKAGQMMSNRQMIDWWNSPENDDPKAQPPAYTGQRQNDHPKRGVAQGTPGHADILDSSAQKMAAGFAKSDQAFDVVSMLKIFKSDVTFIFYSLCLLCALGSALGWYFLISVYLLAVIHGSPILTNVITAVTRHSKALLLTAVLCAVVVYLFTVIAFTIFRDQFELMDDLPEERYCDSFYRCFAYLLVNAVRAGGGIGDIMLDHDWEHPYHTYALISDFLFFAIIIVILLNIISGIIIDTFARLREERQLVEDDIRSKCFICGIKSTQFDRQGEGFEAHIKHDHNLWLYVYFLHHLMTKDFSEFNGQESYVYSRILCSDLSFFPLNKAIILEGQRDEEDQLVNVELKDKKIQSQLDDIEVRMTDIAANWQKFSVEQKTQVKDLCESAVTTVVDSNKTAEEEGILDGPTSAAQNFDGPAPAVDDEDKSEPASDEIARKPISERRMRTGAAGFKPSRIDTRRLSPAVHDVPEVPPSPRGAVRRRN